MTDKKNDNKKGWGGKREGSGRKPKPPGEKVKSVVMRIPEDKAQSVKALLSGEDPAAPLRDEIASLKAAIATKQARLEAAEAKNDAFARRVSEFELAAGIDGESDRPESNADKDYVVCLHYYGNSYSNIFNTSAKIPGRLAWFTGVEEASDYCREHAPNFNRVIFARRQEWGWLGTVWVGDDKPTETMFEDNGDYKGSVFLRQA